MTQRSARLRVWNLDRRRVTPIEFNYTVTVTYTGVPMNFIVDDEGLAGYLVLNSDGSARYVVDDMGRSPDHRRSLVQGLVR